MKVPMTPERVAELRPIQEGIVAATACVTRAIDAGDEGALRVALIDMGKCAFQAIKKEQRFSFGTALELLKEGRRVQRAGWNGKGMWLVLLGPGDPVGDEGIGDSLRGVTPVRVAVSVRFEGVQGTFSCLPWIGMKTADDCFVPWLASQTDVLAEDWSEVT